VNHTFRYLTDKLLQNWPHHVLIEELFKFHNRFQIKLNMSKSIKTNAVISFEIDLG
jgi:hypothetical protein